MDKGKLSTGANLLRLSTRGINFVLCTFAGLGAGLAAQKVPALGRLGDDGRFFLRRFDELFCPVPGFEKPESGSKKTSRPMTSPALNRAKAKPLSDSHQAARWMIFVLLMNLMGGVVGVFLPPFFLQKKDMALGFFIGSKLSALNHYALQSLTGKLLSLGDEGRKWFWFWNILRWILLAAACRVLIFVSPACLLAAMGSYGWFLVVLGLAQWRSHSLSKTS